MGKIPSAMTFKEAIKDWKIIVGTIAVLGAAGGAVGYQFDRPVWASELRAVIQQVQQNYKSVQQMQIDILQRRIWEQEDRNAARPSKSGKQRLRELRQQMKRLEEKK